MDGFETTPRGVPVTAVAALYPLWVLQRGLDWFAALDGDAPAGTPGPPAQLSAGAAFHDPFHD